ncbi:MAG: ABC transporter permease [Thermomicrobiales bacterium]|nr:ABC transporter permease [Thermomicrobiales bacterium]
MSNRLKGIVPTLFSSVAAVAIALAVGAVFILISNDNPIDAYRALVTGAFGDRRSIAETLIAATPYTLGGLAFAVAARAGMFNIGIEGQFMMGGLAAGLFAASDTNLPAIIFVPLALVLAMIGGGVWGAIAGVLKAKTGAHEVITTIMLNYLAFRVNNYIIAGAEDWLPVDPQIKGTDKIDPAAALPRILDGTRLHAGIFIALAAAIVLWYVLFRTTFGYRLRTVGQSPGAAAYAGIPWGLTIALAMFISGACAGLAGASEALGLQGRHYSNPPGYGFTAIAVGLVGRNHPIGMIFAGVLFGALRSGSTEMQNQVGTSKELVLILQGLVILAVAAISASDRIRIWIDRRRNGGGRLTPQPATIGVEPDAPPAV